MKDLRDSFQVNICIYVCIVLTICSGCGGQNNSSPKVHTDKELQEPGVIEFIGRYNGVKYSGFDRSFSYQLQDKFRDRTGIAVIFIQDIAKIGSEGFVLTGRGGGSLFQIGLSDQQFREFRVQDLIARDRCVIAFRDPQIIKVLHLSIEGDDNETSFVDFSRNRSRYLIKGELLDISKLDKK